MDPAETPTSSSVAADTTGSRAYVEAWQRRAGAPIERSSRATLRVLRDAGQVVLIALVLFLGTRTVVQGREVRGPSMQPAYHNGQRLFVTRYLFHGPRRGDVVVFRPPAPGQDDYIKRVIGLPGDRVVIRDGRVSLNGRALAEPYLGNIRTACFQVCDLTLGPGEYFVMGDNRANSSDSRAFGPVSRGRIVGKAWLLYFPVSDFGLAP